MGFTFKEIEGSFHVQTCTGVWYDIVPISPFSVFPFVFSLLCSFLLLSWLLLDPFSCGEQCLIHLDEYKEINTILRRSGKADERKPKYDR